MRDKERWQDWRKPSASCRKYVDSGGSERAGQLWLLTADELRKFKDSAAKHANDVSEHETKFIGKCA
jgi:hypothetical protein